MTHVHIYILGVVLTTHYSRGAICLKCNTSIKGISELLLTRERERAVIFLVHDNSCQIMHGFHQPWRVHQLSSSFFLFSFLFLIFFFLIPPIYLNNNPKQQKTPCDNVFKNHDMYTILFINVTITDLDTLYICYIYNS